MTDTLTQENYNNQANKKAEGRKGGMAESRSATEIPHAAQPYSGSEREKGAREYGSKGVWGFKRP